MIQINHLSKSYQGKKVLDIEQLSIPPAKALVWSETTVQEKPPFLAFC